MAPKSLEVYSISLEFSRKAWEIFLAKLGNVSMALAVTPK